jgi:hypothetical protein
MCVLGEHLTWIHRNVFAVRLPWQVGSFWRSPGAASRRCTTSAAEMALLRGAPLEREDTRARGAPGDGVLERRGRLRQRTCRRGIRRSLARATVSCEPGCAVSTACRSAANECWACAQEVVSVPVGVEVAVPA